VSPQCPYCKTVFNQEECDKNPEFCKYRIEDHIAAKTHRWVKTGTAIIGFIILLMGFTGYLSVMTLIKNEFAKPAIQKILADVARKEAKSIIEERVNPSITSTKERINGFKKYLDESENKFQDKYIKISYEVAFLESISNLYKLAGQALSNPETSVMDIKQLYNIVNTSNDKTIKSIAKSEIVQIKAVYITGSFIQNISIKDTDNVEKVKTDNEIPTDMLISKLETDKDWKVQSKAAELLASRHEKGVPQALLKSICTNPSLEVVKYAITSFVQITGFPADDVFGYEDNAPNCEKPTKWWKENEQRITPQLK
jgi:hypothetical protein